MEIGQTTHIGANYVWPPPRIDMRTINRVIFIAAGVGIQPLISTVSQMLEIEQPSTKVHFIYVTRVKGHHRKSDVAFLEELTQLSLVHERRLRLHLLLSGHPSRNLMEEVRQGHTTFEPRRMLDSDLLNILGDINAKQATIFYVCCPPQLMGHIVGLLHGQVGVASDKIFYDNLQL